MKKGNKMALALVFGLLLVINSGIRAFGQDKPDWQQHIDWAANDTGHPNCPERYTAHAILAQCLWAGNRYCVTDIAIEAAYRRQDELALWLMAEITQCHNGGASSSLHSAGPQAVGDYLRGFEEPYWARFLNLAF